jgi:hypothetical protein
LHCADLKPYALASLMSSGMLASAILPELSSTNMMLGLATTLDVVANGWL